MNPAYIRQICGELVYKEFEILSAYIMNKIVYLFAIIAAAAMSCAPTKNDKEMTILLDSGWQFRQADKQEWMPAEVPGSAHTDLLNNKVIEHPYYRLNEHNLQWVDKVDWEYRTTFVAEPGLLANERLELVFE